MNLMKKLIAFTLFSMVLALIFVFSTLWYFANDLPDYKVLLNYEPPISSRIHSGEGKLIAEYALQKRLFIPYESIPKKIIYSFLSAEDKNFFAHPGVDARGILRASIKNIKNILNTKRLEGASTITQQVAKNFLLSNEVSIRRKIKEAILAFRIEKAFTKERIMELYLNQIYLGHGTYGIAAASLEYFDKSVNELNYSESALLAALPKAPSKYDPYKSPDLATKRRNMVLKNLLENSFISKKDHKKYTNSKIILNKRNVELVEDANFYAEEVRRLVNENYGFDKLYKEGLSIRTPLNSHYQSSSLKVLREGLELYDRRKGWRGPLKNLQNKKEWVKLISLFKLEKNTEWHVAKVIKVEEFNSQIQLDDYSYGFLSFEDIYWTRKKTFKELLKVGDIIYVKKKRDNIWVLKQLPKINGAVTVIDPYTGRVLAMVGGFSFKLSEFNRVTQAKRQPGSAFKPFVYASALENGFTPSSIVLDAPFVAEQGKGLKMWKPQNYGKKFYGPSTLRKGIENSRNLMTVRVAQKLGLEKISDISKTLEIYDTIPNVLSVSLGAAETTLLKLTNAYCSFVNGGKKVTPILIDRIQDRRGKTIFNADKRTCIGCEEISYLDDNIPKIKDNLEQVISPETAYQITSMLEGVVKRGTGKKLRNLNLTIAGKTGTTNNYMDTWFIGFNSKIVIGVYVGFDEPKTLGKYETGSRVALPIFKKFVETNFTKQQSTPFKIPQGISLMMINSSTGKPLNLNRNKTIFEAFKTENLKRTKFQLMLNQDILGKEHQEILKFY